MPQNKQNGKTECVSAEVDTFDLKREGKMLEMLHDGYKVARLGKHLFYVQSQANRNKAYQVTLGEEVECACPDFQYRCRQANTDCKHLRLVKYLEERGL